jgi:hypothetical protein
MASVSPSTRRSAITDYLTILFDRLAAPHTWRLLESPIEGMPISQARCDDQGHQLNLEDT